jgi:hypothetical protein
VAVFASLVLILTAATYMQQPAVASADVHLSPQPRGSLQAEMRGVARGTLVLAIARRAPTGKNPG